MKLIGYLVLMAIFCGCTETNDPLQKVETGSRSDTSIQSAANSKAENYELNDSATYLGFLNDFYFLDNNEFYVELYFSKNVDTQEEYDKIVKLGDSIIFKDDENTRTRIPLKRAREHVDLTGLTERLTLFDSSSNRIGRAEFVRVEFLNQNISPAFIAVFKSDKELIKNAHYCAGNERGSIKPGSFPTLADSTLTGRLLADLNIQRCSYMNLGQIGTHFKLTGSDSILSVINSEDLSYVILSTENEKKVLYKSGDKEHITSAVLIPLIRNGMPQLLTLCIMPEGDMQWENLLTFDGSEYHVSPRQRLP